MAILAGLFPFDTPPSPNDAASRVVSRGQFSEPLERLVIDGVADGTLDVDNPAETAELLFNAAGWTYVHLRAAHGWDEERVRRGLVALLLDGVDGGRRGTPAGTGPSSES